jgi:hypothetical protein
MANHCTNKLTIRGETKILIEFKKRAWKNDNEPLSFETTVPEPTGITNLNLILKKGKDYWYNWQLENWGCKWGPYTDSTYVGDIETHKNGKGKLVYTFETPWSPPTAWIVNTSRLFPTLKFENYCDEPGNCFRGTETIVNGVIIKDTIKNT